MNPCTFTYEYVYGHACIQVYSLSSLKKRSSAAVNSYSTDIYPYIHVSICIYVHLYQQCIKIPDSLQLKVYNEDGVVFEDLLPRLSNELIFLVQLEAGQYLEVWFCKFSAVYNIIH